MQPGRVAGDGDRLLGQVQPPVVVRRGDVRVADRVDDQAGQVDRRGLQRPSGVEPGQQQHIFDERGHPGGLRLDPAHRVRHVRRYRVGHPAGQLGVPPDRGQRRAQLVAGVGDEMPYPRLAGLPRGQRVGHVAEHPVECGTHLPDLGARIGVHRGYPHRQRHLAPVQRQLGDPARGGGDAAQRSQVAADDRRADQPGEQRSGQPDGGFEDDDRVAGGVDVGHRQAGVERVAVAGVPDRQAVRAETGDVAGVRLPVARQVEQDGGLGGGQVLPGAVEVHLLGVHVTARDDGRDGAEVLRRRQPAGAVVVGAGAMVDGSLGAAHRRRQVAVQAGELDLVHRDRGTHADQRADPGDDRDERHRQPGTQRPPGRAPARCRPLTRRA